MNASEFTLSFHKCIKEIKHKDGDLNLNLLDMTNNVTVNFYDTIFQDNYSPLIKMATLSANHSEPIIGQILVHNKLFLNESLIEFSGNLFLDISDHFAQYLIY